MVEVVHNGLTINLYTAHVSFLFENLKLTNVPLNYAF